MSEEVKEGILKNDKRYTSLSKIKTLDAIGEGPIDGLVTREYVYVGEVGNIGWTSVTPGNEYSPLRSVYFNETPVMNTNGKLNFQATEIDWTNGLPDGETASDNIDQTVSKTRTLSERLRGPTIDDEGTLIGEVDSFAKFYRVLNDRCNEIDVNIKLDNFSKTSQESGEQGDIQDTQVNIVVQKRALFTDVSGNISSDAGFETCGGGNIQGKISSGYIESYHIDLGTDNFNNVNFVGWEIKVYRSTEESVSIYEKNQTYVDTLTEYYADTFCYPNSAIIASKFSAEYFSEVPDRAYDCRLKKVRIPSNYNSLTRTYNSHWNGVLKKDDDGNYVEEYTSNPAWCFYDLLTNRRYGLGKYIEEDLVDKWTLYDISKYCDTLVDDGYGFKEPRFTCNLMIGSREEAFKVVNDMASIFRAIAYYSAGGIHTIQDSEKEPVYSFTNANIKDGDFTYSNSAKKVRHTVAIIRYNDKRNFYKPAIEYVENVDGIRRYGIRQKEVTAFGCSSRGQALRFGRWILYTENLETETVSFVTGLEGAYLRPGDVIKIYDNNVRNDRRGGRIEAISYDASAKTTTVKLDSLLENLSPGSGTTKQFYYFDLLTPTYTYYASLLDPDELTSENSDDIRRAQIQQFSFSDDDVATVYDSLGEEKSEITFTTLVDSTDYHVEAGQVWTAYPSGNNLVVGNLDEASNVAETYRIINVQESEDNEYGVQAVEYNQLKYAAIESGLSFDNVTYSVTPDIPSAVATQIIGPAAAPHTKYIEYTITPPANQQGLYNFYVYVKKGEHWTKADFNENYAAYQGITPGSSQDTAVTDASKIPNASFRIAVLPKDTVVGLYVPSEGGRYSFKVFSANAEGGTSDSKTVTSNDTGAVNPIIDTTLKNLRLSSDTDTTNTAGTNDAALKTFKGYTSPQFNWTFAFLDSTLSNIASNYGFRFTVRKTNNDSNTPLVGYSSNILYEKHSIETPNTNLNVSEFFNFADNLASPGGPHRKFDVVVEAHDDDYSSSANSDGAQFKPTAPNQTDSSYGNSVGYDIITVENKQIARSDLNLNETTHDSMNAEIFFQIAEPRGQVKIVFTKCNVSDVQGGFVFLSASSFNLDDVEGENLPPGMQAIRFNSAVSTGSILEALPIQAIRDSDKVYVAIGLFDTFDKQIETDDANFDEDDLRKSIKINGVSDAPVEVAKSAEISETVGQGFRNWIRINLDGSWYGQGIGRVVELDADDTSEGSDDTGDDKYQPWHYKNFIGYRGYACSYIHTETVFSENITAQWPDIFNDGHSLGYLQNLFCGVVWTEDDEVLQAYINEKKVGDYEDYSDHEIIQHFGYPENYRMKGGSRTNDNYGFKRYRIFFDQPDHVPADDKYAIMGVCTDNEPYIPNLHIGTTTPEGRMPIHQSDWDNQVWADWAGIIHAGGLAYTPANTPYMGDIPGQVAHHPAGFGQGWGGLLKSETYFDVHMGHLIDSTYLTDAFFAVVQTHGVSNVFAPKADS
jgi:hypothetical protein